MTSLAALSLLVVAQSSGPIIELSHPEAGVATIACAVKLPKLDSRGAAAAEMLSKALEGNTALFSRLEMRRICVPGGEPRVSVMPDHLSIQMTVLPGDLGIGTRILASMLMNARLDEEAAARVVEAESLRALPGWLAIMDDQLRNYSIVKPNDLRELYTLVMRPENVSVAVGGAIEPGVAGSAWAEATTSWRPARLRPLTVGWDGKMRRTKGPKYAALVGPEWDAGTQFAPKLLAMVALGSGKGSSLFRVVRERMGLSYRQDALLWPTNQGWRANLIMGLQPMEDNAAYLAKLGEIKEALLTDVSSWSEADLQRAQGYATALVTRGGDASPLFFRYAAPFSSDVYGQTMMAAYWKMKTGSAWDAQALGAAFTNVSLEQLKADASALLSDSSPTVSG
jgi:hypothetical protein